MAVPTITASSELSITNVNADEVYIDPSKVEAYRSLIISDFNKVIQSYDRILTKTKKLKNHKGTKKHFQTQCTKLINQGQKKIKNSNARVTGFKNKLDSDVRHYTLMLLAKLQPVTASIDNLEQKSKE